MNERRKTFGIGSTIWIFDERNRVYKRDEYGRAYGGPIWREHWTPATITRETSRSWVTGQGWNERKISKKNANPSIVAFSPEEIDRAAYVHDNAARIADEVQRLRDYGRLKQIATLLGYVEAKP